MQLPFGGPTRRDRQRDLTRARLFEAALAEFGRVGFDRASVARIAREAGVSRPSFYFHFPTKEHVLLELQWGLEHRAVERLRNCESLRETLCELAESMIDSESSVGDPEVFRDMLKIHVRRPPGLHLDDTPFPVLLELGRRFEAAAAKGELRDGLDPEQATQLCMASVFGYLIANTGSPDERRADLHTLVSLYLHEGD
jgi:AcrR family transcriptional regulator